MLAGPLLSISSSQVLDKLSDKFLPNSQFVGQCRRPASSNNSPGLCSVAQRGLLSSTRFSINLLLTSSLVLIFALGFLICIPMLDEWKSENGIQVIEGWDFQVTFLFAVILQVLINSCLVLL